jgi:hypothetical protein
MTVFTQERFDVPTVERRGPIKAVVIAQRFDGKIGERAHGSPDGALNPTISYGGGRIDHATNWTRAERRSEMCATRPSPGRARRTAASLP